MANNVRAWSITAASNGSADADIDASEGCPPSSVNDAERQMMAKLKNTLQGVEYLDRGDTATYISATSFASPGDMTAVYLVGRRLQFGDSTTLYGTIRSVSYVAANTTVTAVLDSGSLSASLSTVSVASLAPTNISKPGIFSKDTYALTTGSSTALVADPVPAVPTLTTGHTITIRTHTSVGASPNINVSGLGEKALKAPGNGTIAAGDYGADVFAQITYESGLSAWLINGGAKGSVTFPAQIFATGGDTLTAAAAVINIFNGTASTSVTLPNQTALASGWAGELWNNATGGATITLNVQTADTLTTPEGTRSAITLYPGDDITVVPGTTNNMRGQIRRATEWAPLAVFHLTSAQSASTVEVLNLENLGSGIDVRIRAQVVATTGVSRFAMDFGTASATWGLTYEGVVVDYDGGAGAYNEHVFNGAGTFRLCPVNTNWTAGYWGAELEATIFNIDNTAQRKDVIVSNGKLNSTANRTVAILGGAGAVLTLGPIKAMRFGGDASTNDTFTQAFRGDVVVEFRRRR